MTKQKSSGGQSKQSATESGGKAGPQDARGDKAKEVSGGAKPGGKADAARKKRKR